MVRRIVLIVILLAAVAGGAYYTYTRLNAAASSTTANLQTTTVSTGTLVASVAASGSLASPQTGNATWQVSGVVGQVHVKVGDQVKANQVLMEVDPNQLDTSIVQAQAALLSHQQTLANLVAPPALSDLANAQLLVLQDTQAITTAQTRLVGAQRRGATTSVNTVNVQVASADQITVVSAAISDVLRQRHNVLAGAEDFTVQSQADTLSALTSVTNTLTLFLGGIAGISLVVGGIGVMNIMLVSVTERTREIGIRKAVGARRADILTQFLVESAALSLLGGLIGIALGWGIAAGIGRVQLGGNSITPVVGVDSMLLATAFSAAIGLFFGIYPAMRAASLAPVEALRYE
jgi:hypothetical protein